MTKPILSRPSMRFEVMARFIRVVDRGRSAWNEVFGVENLENWFIIAVDLVLFSILLKGLFQLVFSRSV